MTVEQIERELQVLGVFRQLLDQPTLGPEENFFEAGGTSLLAARLTARLRSTGVLDVATSTIFAAPTARALTLHAAFAATVPAAEIANTAPAASPSRSAAGSASAAVDRGARQRTAFARRRPERAAEVEEGR